MSETLSQLHLCIEKNSKEQEDLLNDSMKNANSPFHAEKLSAAFMTSKLWPKGRIINISFIKNTGPPPVWTSLEKLKEQKDVNGKPVEIDPLEISVRKLPNLQQAVIEVVKQRIDPICNLTFKFVEKDGDVRVSFMKGKGSWALLGTDCLTLPKDQPTVNFGWMDVATIIHEFGHVIGMIHEHQNPLGKGIPWDTKKVYAWAKSTQGWDEKTTYNNILMKYDLTQINGSSYDPKSIMLYFFPGILTTTGIGTQQNRVLSNNDIKYILNMYPGDDNKTAVEFAKNVYGRNYNIQNNALDNSESESQSQNTLIPIWIVLFMIAIIFIIGCVYYYYYFKYLKIHG